MKAYSGKDIAAKKFTTLPLKGQWREVMGQPETSGVWLIMGGEKHGKTTLSLMLATILSAFGLVLFVSADMGIKLTLQEAMRRAGVDFGNRNIQYLPYIPLPDLFHRLRKRQAARIVIIDNLTRYEDELKKNVFNDMVLKFPTTLFILLAHEEKGNRVNAITRHTLKNADIIMRVEGLAANVYGRCPGGVLIIDAEKAMIYHGSGILQKNENNDSERILRETA